MYDEYVRYRSIARAERSIRMRREEIIRRYGPWALVAGGSQGLGAALAEELARTGLHLVLIARNSIPLEHTAERLRRDYGVQVRTFCFDLADADILAELELRFKDLDIGLLVYDAAGVYTGHFLKSGLSQYFRMLDTNCRTPLSLVYRCATGMKERGRGGIIIMSSMSAFQGSPFVGVYGATKAFLLNLSESIGSELKAYGIDVLCCCPGPVRTPNYLASKPKKGDSLPLETEPAFVARAALKALGRKRIVIPGVLPFLSYIFMTRLLPRTIATILIRRNTESLYGG